MFCAAENDWWVGEATEHLSGYSLKFHRIDSYLVIDRSTKTPQKIPSMLDWDIKCKTVKLRIDNVLQYMDVM